MHTSARRDETNIRQFVRLELERCQSSSCVVERPPRPPPSDKNVGGEGSPPSMCRATSTVCIISPKCFVPQSRRRRKMTRPREWLLSKAPSPQPSRPQRAHLSGQSVQSHRACSLRAPGGPACVRCDPDCTVDAYRLNECRLGTQRYRAYRQYWGEAHLGHGCAHEVGCDPGRCQGVCLPAYHPKRELCGHG